ncbi:hypothetical protein RHMOL_Rhmol04G0029800 [Rhododendron molle]|uniref:Uncharacterized protein n=1 Tax=Rhododendron molle TaxID=49168 RepID=A0ACC0NWR9_RHOML|nr:hypothetical protein RHMOL_Rhmol04G0029800 [Rhododendron molle]
MEGFVIPLCILSLSIFSILITSNGVDTIATTKSLADGETIVSSGGIFELGFFSPGNSTNRYVGIWYKKILPIMTVVWVANRETPLFDKAGVLKLTSSGILVLVNGTDDVIWSTNTSRTAQDLVAQLLDSGVFTLVVNTHGYPQIFIRNGTNDLYGTGPWNGFRFSGIPDTTAIPGFSYYFLTEDVFYSHELTNTSVVTRCVLTQEGYITLFVWVDQPRSWFAMASAPKAGCDMYASCGSYGECLDKFLPTYPKDWDRFDWSRGCVRKTPLGCHEGGEDGFVMYSRVKLPDTRNSWFNTRMNLEECRRTCLENCSCMAYASLDIREAGSGCLLWFDDLIDIKEVIGGSGQDIYLRMASSESGVNIAGKDLLSFDLSTSIGADNTTMTEASKFQNSRKKEVDLPRFNFASVSVATDKFSDANKLGDGGFGPVYKGRLQKGYMVAVKRLSRKSGQALEEFQNEAMLIAKLQHKNLVRLLGCCIDGDKKILIYEYMPNKSLDFFLFDPMKHGILNWELRLKIIEGIAQGLLYLHEYSRLRIIHRDLKASNILLDKDMNPKISDFGMARIFAGNGSQETKRIVGTYGYMSPEYALKGLFSVKSDVFSFGVLVLEILSGKRNTAFHDSDSLDLLGYAWDLWKNRRGLDLKDPILEDKSSTNMLLRYINIGLLCVQESAADRPTMSVVVSMLNNELFLLPSPKQPAFSINRSVLDSTSHKCPEICSGNDVTISILEAR